MSKKVTHPAQLQKIKLRKGKQLEQHDPFFPNVTDCSPKKFGESKKK
jgi:hypothetical protein